MNNLKLNQMKKDIFTKTLNKVCKECGISKKDIFSKSKKQETADSRHLLYYVCLETPHFKISYLQRYMKDHGYKAYHSEIIYGYNKIKNQIEIDEDIKSKIGHLQAECINS